MNLRPFKFQCHERGKHRQRGKQSTASGDHTITTSDRTGDQKTTLDSHAGAGEGSMLAIPPSDLTWLCNVYALVCLWLPAARARSNLDKKRDAVDASFLQGFRVCTRRAAPSDNQPLVQVWGLNSPKKFTGAAALSKRVSSLGSGHMNWRLRSHRMSRPRCPRPSRTWQ